MKISLCIICKDEEEKIERCISSVREVVDETIVVDTGSTDNTIVIAKQNGAKIYEMKWEDDFSKARNFALEKASGDWIIFLDADEYMMEQSIAHLRRIIQIAEDEEKDYSICEILNEGEKGYTSCFKTIRIFKHNPSVCYEGRVHEKLVHQQRPLKGIDHSDKIKILHDGYLKSEILRKQKSERNGKLLLKELEKQPCSSNIHFYLMENYKLMQDNEKAFYHGMKVLEYKNSNLDGVYEATYTHILDMCKDIEMTEQMVEGYYNEAIKCNDCYPDYEYRYAVYLYQRGHMELCIEHLEKCIEKMEKYEGNAASTIMAQILEVWRILGECYIAVGRQNEAVKLFVQILRVAPYTYNMLYKLLLIIQESEKVEAIGNFLGKIYNLTSIKDQVILLKVSEQLKNDELHKYFWNKADEATRSYILDNK